MSAGQNLKEGVQLSAFVLSTDRKEEASWRGSFLTEMQGKTFKLQGVRGCRGARGRTSRPLVKARNIIKARRGSPPCPLTKIRLVAMITFLRAQAIFFCNTNPLFLLETKVGIADKHKDISLLLQRSDMPAISYRGVSNTFLTPASVGIRHGKKKYR